MDLEDALEAMLAAGTTIQKWARGGQQQFLDDPMRQAAIERQFELMGDAASHVPHRFTQQHPDIPWRSITSFRLLLASGPVRPQQIWDAIAGPLKDVVRQLQTLRG